MNPLRVLQLQTGDGLAGGIASYISELVRWSVKQNCECIVAVGQAEAEPAKLRTLYGHATVVPVPCSYTLWSLAKYVRSLRAIIRSYKVDVVHAHALRSALAAALVSVLEGIPLVYTNHGLRFRQKSSYLMRTAFWLMEWTVCRIARRVCAIRPFDHAKLFQSRLVGIDRLLLIKARISRQGNPPAAPTVSIGAKALPLLVGVGSVIDVKRPDRFLQWLHAVAKRGYLFRALWIGDGALRRSLEQRATELRIAVKFIGNLPRSEVFGVLSQAHALLLTSQFEIFPFVVLEAYSQGVPVVSGYFDGVDDLVVEGRTGLLVDADNPVEAADAIERLLKDRELRDSMGRQAFAMFNDQFSDAERMVEDYANLYRGVVAQRV